ncbi:MAG: Ig-like domain-containing protein, partial [Thermoplasmata archaeon]
MSFIRDRNGKCARSASYILIALIFMQFMVVPGARANPDPIIELTIPEFDEINVETVAGNCSVRFNESMDTSITDFDSNLPGAIGSWNSTDCWFNISYSELAESTLYYVNLAGHKNLGGVPLAGTANLSFTTGDFTPPYIIDTHPANDTTISDLAAPIQVKFNETMNTTSVSTTCNPNPGGWSLVWTTNNTILTLSHANFTESTTYKFTIPLGKDLAGNGLVAGPVPNPWYFTTKDITDPASNVTAGGAYWQNSSPFTINYSASDAGGSDLSSVHLWYRYRADNSSDFGVWADGMNDTSDIDGKFEWEWPDSEGIYEFFTIAEDGDGNIEVKNISEAGWGYDRAEPTSSVVEIAAWHNTNPQNVSVNADGTGSEVASVELQYSREGAEWITYGTLYAAPWNWSFNFATTGGAGHYWLRSNVTDAAGNSNNSGAAETWIGYDITAPIVEAGSDEVRNNTFNTVAGRVQISTASDPSAGETPSDNLTYQWAYSGPGSVSFSALSSLNTDINASADGTYTIWLNVTDGAGNEASSSFTLVWDETEPTSSVVEIAAWHNTNPQNVSVNADGTGSEVASVELQYSREGAEWITYGTLYAAPWNWSFNFATTGGAGHYWLRSNVTDASNARPRRWWRNWSSSSRVR